MVGEIQNEKCRAEKSEGLKGRGLQGSEGIEWRLEMYQGRHVLSSCASAPASS